MTTLGNASAASNTVTTAAATDTATDSAVTDPDPATPTAHTGPHQANGITETILTGDDATKVQAAVLQLHRDSDRGRPPLIAAPT